MLEHAEYFESWIQGFRRRRLSALYGVAEEMLYCQDDAHSQQNRCLVSGRLLGPLGRKRPPAAAVGVGEPSESGGGACGGRKDSEQGERGEHGEHGAFFARLNAQFIKYEAVLPVDLRARGLVSSRYGHDGTGLN